MILSLEKELLPKDIWSFWQGPTPESLQLWGVISCGPWVGELWLLFVSLKTIPRIKMGHYSVGVPKEEPTRQCIVEAYSAPLERFQRLPKYSCVCCAKQNILSTKGGKHDNWEVNSTKSKILVKQRENLKATRWECSICQGRNNI